MTRVSIAGFMPGVKVFSDSLQKAIREYNKMFEGLSVHTKKLERVIAPSLAPLLPHTSLPTMQLKKQGRASAPKIDSPVLVRTGVHILKERIDLLEERLEFYGSSPDPSRRKELN